MWMQRTRSGGQLQELRHRLPQRQHALRVTPDGEAAVDELRDRAGGTDRGVHLIGTQVLGFERLRRGRGLRLVVAGSVIGLAFCCLSQE